MSQIKNRTGSKVSKVIQDGSGCGNVQGQTNSLIPQQIPKSPKKTFPVFMIGISVLQILAYYWGGVYSWFYFAYDPFRKHEVWRLITLMFVHATDEHLWTHVIYQLILGVPLEIYHHWKRIGIIFCVGILGGTLFTTLFESLALMKSGYGQGASCGFYALVYAHIATLVLNWNEIRNTHKLCRVFGLLYILYKMGIPMYKDLGTDTAYSHTGHIGGALTGFLVSIVVLKNFVEHPWEKKLQKRCGAILIYLAVIIVVTNIASPVTYYEMQLNTNYQETLFTILLQYSVPSYHPFLMACSEDKSCADAWAKFKKSNSTGNIAPIYFYKTH